MTFLNSVPTEQRQSQQELALKPADSEAFEPGFFEGGLTGAAYGLGRAMSILNRGSAEAIYGVNAPIYGTIDELFGTSYLERAQYDLREKPRQAIAAMTPDPYTTGFIGKVLYGLVGTGVPAAAGGLVGGPAGAATAAGLSTGVGTYADLTTQGVDERTAMMAASLDGLLMAGGVAAPAGLTGKTLLSTLGYGPGVNIAQDVLASQSISSVLESSGYDELAERYAHIDAQTLVTDAILGMGFGYLGSRPVDFALASRAYKHAEVDTAPGIPANLAAAQSHASALAKATEQLLNGERVNVDQPRGAFIPKPGIDAMSILRESGYPELLDDIRLLETELQSRGRAIDDPELPVMERRADAADEARLLDLRGQWKAGKLDPKGMDELQRLETQNRLAAKVAGRRIPGVLNMEAYVETEPNLGPIRGFADADNFKSINDQLGHGVGDHAISTIGRVFAEELGDGRVFHRGGDEFVFSAPDAKTFRDAMDRARARLEQAELVAIREDGTTVSRKGIRFSFGEGKTVEEAESAQYRDKEARKAAGLRTDREPSSDAKRSGEGVGQQGGADRAGRDTATEITGRAAEVASEVPNMKVVDASGKTVKAEEVMAEADRIEQQAAKDSGAYMAAVNCFLRNGG